MHNPSFPFSLPMVLDGSTGISLYRRGMPQGVCTEDWVCHHPDVICSLQHDFFEAGSDVVYAPTFAANRAKLSHYHLDEHTVEMNHKLVSLSKSQAQGKLVAGDMTTTGLFIEPFGDATFDEVLAVYREQAFALRDAGVDFLIAETMMTLHEVRAALIAGRETGLPVLLTVTVDENGRTLSGASALACYTVARSLGAAAFGFNCSFGPEGMCRQIEQIAPYADIPLIAKPNAGMPSVDDPLRYDLTPEQMAVSVEKLLAAGVQIVGGCCGAGPEYIAAIRKVVDGFDFDSVVRAPQPMDRLLCDSRDAFTLPNDITLSDPLEVTEDLPDDLMEAEDGDFDVLLVAIHSLDDAEAFAENAYMCKVPVGFTGDSEEGIARALLLYQGRALLDSRAELDTEALQRLSDDYGAAIY